MKLLSKSVLIPNYLYNLTKANINSAIFIDIETTGLSARFSHLYLIGVLYYDPAISGNKAEFRQWFLDRPNEEPELLHALSDYLNEHPGTLIHYNGTGFDLPYLQKKYRAYRLPDPLLTFLPDHSTDLYQVFRQLKFLPGLNGFTQKDAERFLGLSRKDTCSGKDLIDVYRRYLESASEGDLSALLLHNEEDVCSMPSLLPLLSYRDTLNGEWTSASLSTDSEKTNLIIDCALKHPLPKALSYSNAFGTVRIQNTDADPGADGFSSGCLQISMPIRQGRLKYFFPDWKNYYYLPQDDQAVHKSIGAFVDCSRRIPATARTCYQHAAGRFVAVPGPVPENCRAFYCGYHVKPACLRLNDFLALDTGSQSFRSMIIGILHAAE